MANSIDRECRNEADYHRSASPRFASAAGSQDLLQSRLVYLQLRKRNKKPGIAGRRRE